MIATGISRKRLNINPGDYYFGGEYEALYTLLGSCIAVSCWHPRLHLGGLCHYVMPGEPDTPNPLQQKDVGRYGHSVLLLMLRAMQFYAPCHHFQISVYGGSKTMNHFRVGQRNTQVALEWLNQNHIKPRVIDVGENYSRTLTFNLLTGEIVVKRLAIG